MKSLATNLQPEKYVLEITQGSEKGAKYELYAPEIRIGRDEKNDIILSDSKCSREHAIIRMSFQSASVEDLGSQNGILVDGEKTTQAVLQHGSQIQIGATIMTFRRVPSIQTMIYKQSNKIDSAEDGSQNAFEFKTPRSQPMDPKKVRFYLLFGSIVAVAIFFLSQQNKTTTSITENLSVDQEIEASKKRQEDLSKKQIGDGLASRQYLDAQASFMKGLRDYRESYYKSAVISFSAAISIYPEHKLARRYLRLAQNKLDEQIQILMSEGNKAMDENKYQLAQSSFKNVMVLLGETENKTYLEALEKLNECNLLLRESF